ncbi:MULTISPECIES: ROK family transcriptional regulator [unclassified Saccharopolyspora]|uniref:ROK family transcriptional regulator n=1 Tax=unclassified Saccharopolyspora TaxID=2646250 RepID=UPI001CD253E4|nr:MULTISPECIES: ROK family transcriptional regulator [unclassified Saccharopolyspora]MCA1185070.1 ROK family transcriptional regulator [Saccharopolyspora sp. 6T]MCA1191450.1 ROK family transcriptional regulator [Saccharopolyspora sp. 6V]MCA1224945.1 ROK family transcriptional regulator [Saccharopolyspora sp. 6M]MCA1278564.1 ROK family transcriptional regulator [Saccharopolyspora sp. 7B]
MTDPAPTALHRLRQGNAERVLGCLRRHGELSRAAVAERSGLSRTTLSAILGDLIRRGVVVETELPPSHRRGRPTRGLTLNPGAGQYLGLELGRNRIRLVLADAAHRVQARADLSYGSARGAADRLALAERAVREAAEHHGITLGTLAGIGVGSTGPGELVLAPAAGLDEPDRLRGRELIADRLARAFGVPVGVDNNTRLTALAEATWGAAAGASDLLYAHFSHGTGGGLIIGGQLVRGTGGVAAELGHLCVDDTGPKCWCGGHGCLERYASVPAVLRATGHRRWAVVRDALARDGAEAEAVRAAGEHAGTALAAMCTAVNAGRVVLGGELAELGEPFLRPLRESFARRAMRSLRCGVEFGTAGTAPWGGALGGLALALHESPLLARYPLPRHPEQAAAPDAESGR